MICAKPVGDVLQIIHLAPNEVCQFISLIDKNDLVQTTSYLDERSALLIIGSYASLYALTFVFKMVLHQLGFRG